MTSGLSVTAVDCGRLETGKGLFMTNAEGQISVPTAVYIIEHPKHGLILYDTGVNYNVADPEAAEKHWGPGKRDHLGCKLTRDQAIDRQLQNLGYKLNDVKYVIMSHLHLDHAGGMCHFPNATFVVQKKELRFAWWPDPWCGDVYCFNDYKDTRNFSFLELEGNVDLFQDGTIKLVTTPGHSAGHQSMLLRLENWGPIFLGADAAHLREAYEKSTPMPLDWDMEAVYSTFNKMKLIENAGIPIYLSHDPDDWAKFPKNGEYAD